jgi:carbon storage regulator CsrA
MLVLSRKPQQEILIGDNIKVTVLKVKGNTVRIGIEAPQDVKVVRGELPRHDESRPQVSHVTVVFTDPVERPKDRRGRDFEVLQINRSDDESCSISFRQFTPESLKQNRLKEIVQQISKSKS